MDKTQQQIAPVLILSHPQMGENIGSAARVMANFGLRELRLIAPRDGWPNEKATTLAAGAFAKMAPVRIFDDTISALADLQMVYAVTARIRDMQKPVLAPSAAMNVLRRASADGSKTGLLFGAEASGLSNTQVASCDGVITYPIHPEFRSLNLAQAVAVAAYAWRTSTSDVNKDDRARLDPLASKQEMQAMQNHLRAELEMAGFFFPPEKADLMMQNLQNMFIRAAPTVQEIRTFRGVIKALSHGRGPMVKK